MSRILARQGAGYVELSAKKGDTLLEALRRGGLDVPALCGGNGKCGRCRVEIEEKGRRESVLACRYKVEGDLSLCLPENPGSYVCGKENGVYITPSPGRNGVGAAADIGTTAIALKLFDLADGRELGMAGDWNRQRPFGADVISRCQYVMEHGDGLKVLEERIQEQVFSMAGKLMEQAGRGAESLKELYIAGNTVMEHIFMGLSPAGLAVAPFLPESLFLEGEPKYIKGVKTFAAPCAASYVGGDIMAGLLASGVYAMEGRNLFLDIGTNGEMALGGSDGFVCCAVASGPAFEGAGISCGMSSEPGAVTAVRWTGTAFEPEIIGDREAAGFCGSGLISLLALLLELGVIDGSGWLLPPEEAPEELRPWLREDENGNGCFFLTEKLYLTAGDVRQLQLAKAAVAAGIEVLMDRAEVSAEEIDRVYIAGGFGSNLSPEAAAYIGMLPGELAGKTRAFGNSSLYGASMALLDMDSRDRLYGIQRKCSYIELSGDARFNRAFPMHMMFSKEDEEEWN